MIFFSVQLFSTATQLHCLGGTGNKSVGNGSGFQTLASAVDLGSANVHIRFSRRRWERGLRVAKVSLGGSFEGQKFYH